jgi:DNA gyrase/topoisomerase IV subunit B
MDYKRSDIIVLEALEAIRRRPGMYIGGEEVHPSPRVRLLEPAVSCIASEPPQEIRILLWREGVVTIAYDGDPLPVEPFAPRAADVPHPALYHIFMHMCAPAMFEMAILNALSERLVVSTMHGGDRYRVSFSKGMIRSLLTRERYDEPLGTTWLTYLPDTTIVTGEALRLGDVEQIAGRVRQKAEGVRIRVEDRMTEAADWS